MFEWLLEFFNIDMPTLWKPIQAIIDIIVSAVRFVETSFAYIYLVNPMLGGLFAVCSSILVFYCLLKLLKALVPLL